MVPRTRFERVTFPLGGGCSILLSYRGEIEWGSLCTLISGNFSTRKAQSARKSNHPGLGGFRRRHSLESHAPFGPIGLHNRLEGKKIIGCMDKDRGQQVSFTPDIQGPTEVNPGQASQYGIQRGDEMGHGE